MPCFVDSIIILKEILSKSFLSIKEANDNDLFSLDDLFTQLQLGTDMFDDTATEDFIKEIWKESPNNNLREELDSGIAALMEGKYNKALTSFESIVEADPHYAEGWSKLATVHYMLGSVDKSLEAAEQALLIDSRNFQALAGMGLVYMDTASRYDKAIERFRQCLAVHPWLGTASSRLAQCMSKEDTTKSIG